ncbi:MAG TPA: LPS export ABC transporter permease LptF [Burkholderiales bacterium]|jgi:lipopolysaccharide export system permease protein|nr:LPS export ABC transporter permease LptF [Burkholderiales bacterium]
MIFSRSLLREFANLAIAVFLSLFLIAVTTRLIRLLGQAAGGKIPSETVVAFLGFSALSVLPVLLSLTLFITVLLELTRSWRDSEMMIWLNSGLSLTAWIRPVMIFAAPLVLMIGLLSFFISPWAAQMSEEYRSRIDSRDDITRVQPGAFGESRSRERVFFVESIAGDSESVRNVFVNSVQNRRTGVMMSERGSSEYAPNGDRFLVLFSGRRYEGTPGEADFRVMEFERYSTRIQTKEGDEPVATHKSTSTLGLIENPTRVNLGELLWRIGMPVSALVLALLAIPLSFVNPRAGRSVNLMYALLAYMVYSNLLSVSQARVSQGKLPFTTGWWLVHGVMALVALVLFARHLSPLRLRWLRR